MPSAGFDPAFERYIDGVELEHMRELNGDLAFLVKDDWEEVQHRMRAANALIGGYRNSHLIPSLRDRLLHDRKGGKIVGLVKPKLHLIELVNFLMPETLSMAVVGMPLHRVVEHPLTAHGTMGHDCIITACATMPLMFLAKPGHPKHTAIALDRPIMPLLTQE